jgi:predicted RNA binding protein YcfA (HicA-like mRNA interferase family)
MHRPIQQCLSQCGAELCHKSTKAQSQLTHLSLEDLEKRCHSSEVFDSQQSRLLCRTMKVRDVLKLLTSDGWYLVTTAGSHRQLKHVTKRGRVTVAGHPSDDLHPKTLNSILTQAGLKK